MTETVLVEEEIEIRAPREVVFELLTSAKGLREWMAVEAECEPVPGGVVRWRHENGATMRGRFVVVDAPSRIVFTYGWESGGPPVPPESTRVEIVLEERAGGATHLRLVHSLLDSDVAGAHRQGWRWFLGRLGARAEGGPSHDDCALEPAEERPS